MVEQKNKIFKSLETETTQYDPEKVTRYDEWNCYKYLDIQEYLGQYDHKKEFIIERVKDTLSDNLSFQEKDGMISREKVMEELSPKLIETSKKQFYDLLFKETQQSNFYYPVSLPKAMRNAQLALFIPGYATTIKQFYPDKEERRTVRQKYIQAICKELILEIQQRFVGEEGFVAKEYCMRNALLYVYQRY